MTTQIRNMGLVITSVVTLLAVSATHADEIRNHRSNGTSIYRGTPRTANHLIGQPFNPIESVQPVTPFQRVSPRLRPSFPQEPVVPTLGFTGHIHPGLGMVVDRVIPGTAADRMGLERGDVITRINHSIIDCDHVYREALLEAVQAHQGEIAMKIIDRRTGRIVPRTGNLLAFNVPDCHHSTLHDGHDHDRQPRTQLTVPLHPFSTPRSSVVAPLPKSF